VTVAGHREHGSHNNLGPTAPANSFEALAVTHDIDLDPAARGDFELCGTQ